MASVATTAPDGPARALRAVIAAIHRQGAGATRPGRKFSCGQGRDEPLELIPEWPSWLSGQGLIEPKKT